jgi:hypothetical protein
MRNLFTAAGPVVDLRGRSTSERSIKGSALIKAQQWIDFLDEWSGYFAVSEPWVKFALHATMNLHQSFAVLARRLRKNAWWTGGMTMAEQTVDLGEDARARLAWFEKSSQEVDQRNVPAWARFLFAAIEGAFRMQVRIADEAKTALRRGHVVIPVDRMGTVVAEQREDAPNAVGREREQ